MAKLQRSTFTEAKRITAAKTRTARSSASIKQSVSSGRVATKSRRGNAAVRLTPPTQG